MAKKKQYQDYIKQVHNRDTFSQQAQALQQSQPTSTSNNVGATTQPQLTSPTQTKTPSKWEEYQSAIKSYEANAQADLASIQQQTNKYMQNYLNQYGLAGSGAGQTAMVQNANNMANTMSQYNMQNQASSMAFRQGLQDEARAELQTMIDSGNHNYASLQDYINQASQDSGIDASTIDAMNRDLISSGADWKSDRKLMNESISQELSKVTNEALRTELNNAVTEMNNAKDQESYANALKKYEELLNDTNAYAQANGQIGGNDDESTALLNSLAQDKGYTDIDNYLRNNLSYTDWGGDKVVKVNSVTAAQIGKTGNNSGAGSGGKQDAWVQSILDAAKKGNLPNGTAVDMNYRGGAEDVWVYYNGQFYRTGNRLDGDYPLIQDDQPQMFSRYGINFKK